jgi:hypothetical protein
MFFKHDSIAQQKATETTKRDLRALQGGLYPPWSLMLTHIVDQGVFPRKWHFGKRNERKWAKNPQNGFYPKSDE